MTESLDRLALQETLDEIMGQLAEMKRSRANMVRPGTVVSYDAAANQAVLQVGYETHAIDCHNHIGHWNPLVAGQQIMMLCPDGDVSNAMVITGGYLAADKKPSTRDDEQALVPPGAAEGDAALRIRKGGLVRAEVTSRTKFKILIGDQAFAIKETSLEPTSKD